MRSALLTLCSALFFSATEAQVINGVVTSISDGDTLVLLEHGSTQRKIRLAGIDAPEKGQPFGNASKESLSACAFGKRAAVEYGKTDRYGRLVGKVIVNGLDCNLFQVQAGMAWHYKKYQKEQNRSDRIVYGTTEQEARTARRGLWLDHEPMSPWDYRLSIRR